MSKRSAKNTGSRSKSSRSRSKKNISSTTVLIIVAAALIVVIAAIAIGVGCGGKKSQSSQLETQDLNVEVVTNEAGEVISSGSSAVEVARQDLVNTDQIQIEITGIDASNAAGFTIDLEMTNKSDTSYVVAAKYAMVEGLNIDPKWSCQVDAGQVKDSSITFYKSDYVSYGITFTDIQIVISVVEASDTENQILQQAVRIYPYGEGYAKVYMRTETNNDVVLVDNDSYRMTLVGCEKDDVWGYSAKVYIENKTDVNVWFAGSNAAVNGTALDPFWGIACPAGSSAYSTICWTNEQLESAGISDVSEIAMTVTVTNYDDWDAKTIATDNITIKP